MFLSILKSSGRLLVHDGLAKHSILHHKSFRALQQAAGANCHLCSLIEMYCTALCIDLDLPVELSFDLRRQYREYAFTVETEKPCTKIRLGLIGYKPTTRQKAATYYHPSGGIPQAVFDMIQEWLQVCESKHPDCCHNSTAQMPTRLVDVGPAESNTVQLIETNSTVKAPYLTLSHCWGKDPKTYRRTTQGNLSISLEALPRTFQDAIFVTRKLKFRYLWIDSLCIVQGDQNDWEKESVNMARIYANGALNLAASYSADGHGGLMLGRNKLHVTPCRWVHQTHPISSSDRREEWMAETEVCWQFEPQSELTSLGIGRPLPLESRGWVLQENVLSPRTVRFLPGEIMWECRNLSTRESLHCNPEPPTRMSIAKAGKANLPLESTIQAMQNGTKHFLRPELNHPCDSQANLKLEPRSTTDATTQSHLYRKWYEMVEQYSNKDLTWSDDRLPAIWALAQNFQKRTGDEYCSGLWKNDLLAGLLFRRYQQRPTCRRQLNCSPSWSWAFTECRVEFERATSPAARRYLLPDASILRLDIVLTSPTSLSMGRTHHAELEIHSVVREVKCSHRQPSARPSQIRREWRQFEALFQQTGRWPTTTELLMGFGAPTQWHELACAHRCSRHDYSYESAFLDDLCWDMNEARSRQDEKDKVLDSYWHGSSTHLHFDTIELATRYALKVVLCVHIKDLSGLLVEPDGNSQTYHRIGMYTCSSQEESHLWKKKIVRLR
ncbi:hypothetical protein ACJZ2D_012012 [Fusarium nematophilum]